MAQSLARPLSLGNVMSAGITLYRSHLKSYFGMSLKAHLWAFIPVYGWAKFETLKSAISRHAFQELIHEPESLKTAQETLRPKLWGFWVIQFLVNIILFGVQTALNAGLQLVLTPVSVIFADPTDSPTLTLALSFVIVLISLTVFLLYLTIYLWVLTRFFIPELPYAIEENIDLVKALERSLKLTGGKVTWQIIVIICVIGAITTPLYILATIPPVSIFISSLAVGTDPFIGTESTFQWILMLLGVGLLWLFLYLFVSICVMPLWQSLKAVIYYDIRVRKEGLGLTLRDRPN
ncbi:MAG: DUF975 domain-containing protein [Cyanobacteria bacterium P01_E01_bin.6]